MVTSRPSAIERLAQKLAKEREKSPVTKLRMSLARKTLKVPKPPDLPKINEPVTEKASFDIGSALKDVGIGALQGAVPGAIFGAVSGMGGKPGMMAHNIAVQSLVGAVPGMMFAGIGHLERARARRAALRQYAEEHGLDFEALEQGEL